MKHLDVTTHIQYDQDKDILTRKLFDVNLRLLKSSEMYFQIVMLCCQHISWCAKTEKDGYKKPHGFSGANAGIPFNIIATVQNRNTDKESVLVMINPRIIETSQETVDTLSNCGSLTLSEPINITRFKEVTVNWFDLNGQEYIQKFDRKNGGFTIQHEIEHNLGILILGK